MRLVRVQPIGCSCSLQEYGRWWTTHQSCMGRHACEASWCSIGARPVRVEIRAPCAAMSVYILCSAGREQVDIRKMAGRCAVIDKLKCIASALCSVFCKPCPGGCLRTQAPCQTGLAALTQSRIELRVTGNCLPKVGAASTPPTSCADPSCT